MWCCLLRLKILVEPEGGASLNCLWFIEWVAGHLVASEASPPQLHSRCPLDWWSVTGVHIRLLLSAAWTNSSVANLYIQICPKLQESEDNNYLSSFSIQSILKPKHGRMSSQSGKTPALSGGNAEEAELNFCWPSRSHFIMYVLLMTIKYFLELDVLTRTTLAIKTWKG